MKKIILTITLNSGFLVLNCFAQQYGWHPQNSGTANNLNGFANVTSATYYAVGENGTILKTTDNGETWFMRTSGTNNNLKSVIANGNTGLITGTAGTVLRTADQGNTWSALNTGTANDLYAITRFGTPVAVGNNGTIIRSTNGGINWVPVASPTTNHLRSITFVTAALGWIVGNNGTILRTDNGGASWYIYPSPTSNNLNSITYNYWINILWAAGDNGTVLKSIDSGTTWQTLNVGTSSNFNSVTSALYIGMVNAWVCGAGGSIRKTTNGGGIWMQQASGTSNNLNAIFFEDINNGWIAGDYGTILHTYTDIYASLKLDANNISTWFRNNGSFNYDPFNGNNPGFEWPKGTGMHARFASGMWLGAKVGNDTLVAIAYYSFEYLPGYTDNNGIPHGLSDSLYRMYRLTFGVNDADRINWPNSLLGNSDQGAPVYFDNQTNSWKPLDFGNQTLFYRYTDSYPEAHTVQNGSTAPLKADIMKLDFSIAVPGGLGDAAFSEFTVINRSTRTWDNVYFTFWTDDDLGFANDDKIGCDSARNLGYTYNGAPSDPVYGNAPPAVGFLMLRGALFYTGINSDTVYICRNKTRIARIGYKDSQMSVFGQYISSGHPCLGNPANARESFRFMSGYQRCGLPWINPIGGYQTKYMYSGDPVTGQGWIQSVQNDQSFMMSTGPVNMNPGDTQVIVLAQVIARGTSNLNSITALRQLTEVLKNYYNTCYTSPPIGIETISNQVPMRFALFQNYPNPFNPVTRIRFDVPPVETRLIASLRIYDVLGREVAELVNEALRPGTYKVEWDGTNYPSGIYFYRLSAGDFSESKKMVLMK